MFDIDKYSVKARFYPSFLVMLPAFVLCIYYITDVQQYYHYFTAAFSFGLFTYLFSQLGRDRGKAKEPMLNKYFGGTPSTQILRHSNNHLDKITKYRYHSLLQQKIDGITIPSELEELQNPHKADEIYGSSAKYLISKTRDIKRFNLLFKENINYGFRRNLWGMKTWALMIIAVLFPIHVFFTSKRLTTFDSTSTKDIIMFLFLSLAALFWIFIVTKDWIKATSFAYAERLYESLQEL